jgi:hypothetical protein
MHCLLSKARGDVEIALLFVELSLYAPSYFFIIARRGNRTPQAPMTLIQNENSMAGTHDFANRS